MLEQPKQQDNQNEATTKMAPQVSRWLLQVQSKRSRVSCLLVIEYKDLNDVKAHPSHGIRCCFAQPTDQQKSIWSADMERIECACIRNAETKFQNYVDHLSHTQHVGVRGSVSMASLLCHGHPFWRSWLQFLLSLFLSGKFASRRILSVGSDQTLQTNTNLEQDSTKRLSQSCLRSLRRSTSAALKSGCAYFHGLTDLQSHERWSSVIVGLRQDLVKEFSKKRLVPTRGSIVLEVCS